MGGSATSTVDKGRYGGEKREKKRKVGQERTSLEALPGVVLIFAAFRLEERNRGSKAEIVQTCLYAKLKRKSTQILVFVEKVRRLEMV